MEQQIGVSLSLSNQFFKKAANRVLSMNPI